MRPPDKSERRPRRKGGAQEMRTGGGITTIVTAAAINSAVCWRCGVRFALTTMADLAHCAELAHPIRFEDIPREDW